MSRSHATPRRSRSATQRRRLTDRDIDRLNDQVDRMNIELTEPENIPTSTNDFGLAEIIALLGVVSIAGIIGMRF